MKTRNLLLVIAVALVLSLIAESVKSQTVSVVAPTKSSEYIQLAERLAGLTQDTILGKESKYDEARRISDFFNYSGKGWSNTNYLRQRDDNNYSSVSFRKFL